MSAEDTPLPAMRDHWWWRPGWSLGRSFYTWHITFADQPAVHELANRYAPTLGKLLMLDPVPVRWLHLTMQGVGFVDESAGRRWSRCARGAAPAGRTPAVPGEHRAAAS